MPYIPEKSDKLKLAYTFTLGLADLPVVTLRGRCLEPVNQAFSANAMRLKRMMLFPAFVGNFAARTQRFTDVAEFEVTGKVASRYPPDDHKGEEIFERMKQLLQEDTDRLRAESARGREAVDEQVRESIETGGAYAVILTASSPAYTGFKSLLLSYITAAWTIFETLAGDVWEFVINENPNLLAQLGGRANRLRKSRRPINYDRSSDTTNPTRQFG